MKGNKNLFTNLIFLLFAILLIVLSFFSYRHINQQAVASDWVAHTYLVKLKLENAFRTLQKAEAAQRGYILTKDPSFINQFYEVRTSISPKLAEIDSLIAYNPEQVSNFKITRDYFLLRDQFLQTTLDTSDNTTPARLDSFLLKGKVIMDSLSSQIDLMNKVEEVSLAGRIAENKKEKQFSSTFILLFSLLAVSVLLISFLRLKKESRLLNVAEVNKNLLEEKVSERTAELRAANEILNTKKAELERKNEELNSYTFIASHDLKEPLRKIKTYSTKILQADAAQLSADGKNNLVKITESIQKMNNLIDSLVNYAQTEKELKPEKTDLMEITRNALHTLQEAIHEKEAIIEYAGLPVILAMPDQLEQLFTNLLSNSLKYAKDGVKPHIVIAAEKQKGAGSWKITFTDNGIGFDPKYKEKIFDIFQRLHPKHQYSGTGIGLAICKKIVEKHKGTITASSVKDEGAVFTIILPLS